MLLNKLVILELIEYIQWYNKIVSHDFKAAFGHHFGDDCLFHPI